MKFNENYYFLFSLQTKLVIIFTSESINFFIFVVSIQTKIIILFELDPDSNKFTIFVEIKLIIVYE